MTPTEKAKDLVAKFGEVHLGDKTDGTPYFMIEQKEDAKKCASIAAHEIIWLIPFIEQRKYWEEVKLEIEKI